MRVVLAGYNVDVATLRELRGFLERVAGATAADLAALAEAAAILLARDNLTPETLSAAYARVSRDPRPVDELRAAAREEVEKARRSNQSIIFGLGHASVAEHAVFNLDLIGLSRLAVEHVQRSRLASYTEKSQRYIRLEDGFVRPPEIAAAPHADEFVERARAQSALYQRLYERLLERAGAGGEASDPARRRMLEGRAKEDARYVTSIATEAQLGMTANARNLERMITRLAASPLAEVRAVSAALHAAVEGVAPSLVKYTEPAAFDRLTRDEVARAARALLPQEPGRPAPAGEAAAVRLVAATPEADRRVVAALLHSSGAADHDECWRRAASLHAEAQGEIVKASMRRMESWHAALREFEHVGATFELTVSASCFAQLKRHRMATLTAQPYDPQLGVTVPDSVREAGLEREFLEETERASALHAALAPIGPAAGYALTNAHRRRVLVSVNARELYHVSRLREDARAQWDIRAIASRMIEMARREMPLTLLLAAGKDRFAARRAEVFGDAPR